MLHYYTKIDNTMCTRFCEYVIVLILTLMTITLCAFKMSESFRIVDDSAAYVS